MRTLKLLSLVMALCPSVGSACGTESDCVLEDGRHYKIALPDAVPAGAILFAHGFGGSAERSMSNGSLRQMAEDMNLALITVKSAARDWSIPNAPSSVTMQGVDEVAYIDAVMEDVEVRFGLLKQDTVVSGFSAGSMLAWTVACERGNEFAGFVPMSGVFWSPIPSECAADAASVIHIHGTQDNTVPLAGRVVMDTRQGDVKDVLELYKGHGAFLTVDDITTENLQCEVALNPAGRRLEFCQFEGGHQFRTEFLRDAYVRLTSSS